MSSVASAARWVMRPGARIVLPAVRFLGALVVSCVVLTTGAAQTVAVIRSVTDGDSFEVTLNDARERIRLIGIDTPEASANRKAYRDAAKTSQEMDTILAAGQRATAFVKTLVAAGDTVRLEFDVQERDRYGRILAYLYLPDGRMLNEVLLREGYARLYTTPPNVKHEKLFRAASSR